MHLMPSSKLGGTVSSTLKRPTHGVYTMTGGLISAFMLWTQLSKLRVCGCLEYRPGFVTINTATNLNL